MFFYRVEFDENMICLPDRGQFNQNVFFLLFFFEATTAINPDTANIGMIKNGLDSPVSGVPVLSEICVAELSEDSPLFISEDSSLFISEDSSLFISEDSSFSISEDSSFCVSPVTKILISISPSAKISLRVFSPSVRIVFANSPESVTVPFSSVIPSVVSVPARPPSMRTATVSDVEFVWITILSPERPHVMLVCSAVIIFSSAVE